MSTNRIHHLIAVGPMVTVSLLLVLPVRVGSTAAATSTPGGSSSRALQGAVNIRLKGPGRSPLRAEGHFTISGAISDRGWFVAHDRRQGNGGRVRTLFLFGTKGTIRITWVGRTSAWTITKGTKADAGLRGRGSGGNLWRNQRAVDITMEGTVSK